MLSARTEEGVFSGGGRK